MHRVTLMRRGLSLVAISVLSLSSLIACHANAADSPQTPRPPALQVDIEDRGPAEKSGHVAKLMVVLTDRHGKVSTRDGDARYELVAHVMNAEPPQGQAPRGPDFVSLKLHRMWTADRPADIEVESTIAAKTGQVIIAKIDHADGRTTMVTARYM